MANSELSNGDGGDISDDNATDHLSTVCEVNCKEEEKTAVKKVMDLINEFEEKWGFSLEELYKLATKFQKEKEGKALHLSYPEKLQLVARTQQISIGPFDPNIASPVGYLDVIGRDRRQAWQALGNQPKETAIMEYIEILDRVCNLFRPYVEAHKKDLEEKERLKKEKELQLRREEEEREQRRLEEEILQREQHEQRRLELQKQQIQDALNQQTYFQFKAYVEQQLPGNPEQQAILMRQLQEQHYQQYMQQVYQQQQSLQSIHHQQLQQPANVMQDDGVRDSKRPVDNSDGSSNGSSSGDDQSNDLMQMVKPASMWTRKDVVEFKTSIVKEGGESIIKVGHGETVTVRVPTHEDGTCLYWEFATDSYDIGFGVYFEWTKSPGTQVSVHISESEDEDEDEAEEVSANAKGDVEKGVSIDKSVAVDRPPLTVIIPVYRRDCHEEVYAGSHPYPGQGAYLLKFDNSYSLWRSKTLYYRVYYTH